MLYLRINKFLKLKYGSFRGGFMVNFVYKDFFCKVWIMELKYSIVVIFYDE